MGNVNAGRLSWPMFKTFPIRMAMLVGIRGETPCSMTFNNTHLGDAVAGEPSNGQYRLAA
ncbi:hypothetical protein B0J11DRAFT_532267 [Dendryphion nanum]|uniref:Uncharacterized protein n=1 Tax=Dendryphion nanum TaxID=256645 RepID=A0A9P9DL96_9PLEO|nr:hypothetical protein B0J11DRAFT_532267 [Dendryphion nanum]